MTTTITAFERSPDGGKGWRVIRAFVGRSRRWVSRTRFGWFRSAG